MPDLSGSGGGAVPERGKRVGEPFQALRLRHVWNRAGGEVGGGKGSAPQGRLPQEGRSLAQGGVLFARGRLIEAKKKHGNFILVCLVRYDNVCKLRSVYDYVFLWAE